MAFDNAAFVLRFPEFQNIASATITKTIGEADRQVDAAVWGETYEDGVYYLTAHYLASRNVAIGEMVGAVSRGGATGLKSTQYGATYLEMRASLTATTGFSFGI